MMQSCLKLAGLSVFACLPAFADVFPTSQGDISSAAAWGGTVPSEAQLPADGGDFHASADVSFTKFLLNSGAATISLTNAANRTVSITGSGDAFYAPGTSAVDYLFNGGTWNFTKGGNLSLCNTSGTSAPKNNYLTLTNGCAVTGVGKLRVAWGKDSRNRLTIADRSQLSCNSVIMSYHQQDVGSGIEVLSGGRFEVATTFTLQGKDGADNSQGCYLKVDGEGSYAQIGSTFLMNNAQDNFIVVTNGGCLVLNSDLNIGAAQANDSGNAIYVFDGGAVTSGYVRLGRMASPADGPGNRIEIRGGSRWVTSRAIMVGGDSGGCNNTLLVDNSSLTAKGVTIGQHAEASGNTFRIVGQDSTVDFDTLGSAGATYTPFGAPHGLLEIDNANITLPYVLSMAASNCTLRLKNNAVLALNNSVDKDYALKLGAAAASEGAASAGGCRLELQAGTRLEIASLNVGGPDNEVVISNATLQLSVSGSGEGGNGTCLYLGNAEHAPKTGNRVVLAGSTPKISHTGEYAYFTLYNQSELRFILPAEGYAEGYVPVEVDKFRMLDGDSRVTVDCTAALAAMATLNKTVTLIKTRSLLTIGDAVLAAMNATLPAKCAFFKEDGCLKLRLHKSQGMTLIVR